MITVSVESLEELFQFAREMSALKCANLGGAVKKEEPTPEEEPAPAEEKEKPNYTMADVRAKLSEISKAGKKDEVKALIASFGAEKLPEIKEDDFPEVMKKAGEL